MRFGRRTAAFLLRVRRAARTDDNQGATVDYLRSIGWSVFVTSALGGGFPDLVCARPGLCCLVELKDGSKPASKRRLTPAEQRFAEEFTGPYIVALGPEDAERQLLEIWGRMR